MDRAAHHDRGHLDAVGLRGFMGRIAIFLGLIFGYVLSWVFDRVFGQITSFDARRQQGHDALAAQLGQREGRGLDRLPPAQRLRQRRRRLALPGVNFACHPADAPRCHRPGRREHRPRRGGRRDDQPRPRPRDGSRDGADGIGTVIASTFGGSPTTTYAENIGVMAATRVYFDRGLLRGGDRGDPVRALPEVRGDRVRDAGRHARRHHGPALRHDRPARRQDLEGEPGRLANPVNLVPVAAASSSRSATRR